MSDEAIEAIIVDALVDASDNNVDELEEFAEYVLDGLRAAGFELYRPDECERIAIGEIRQVHFDARLADVPIVEIELEPGPLSLVAGTYRLVPVEGDS